MSNLFKHYLLFSVGRIIAVPDVALMPLDEGECLHGKHPSAVEINGLLHTSGQSAFRKELLGRGTRKHAAMLFHKTDTLIYLYKCATNDMYFAFSNIRKFQLGKNVIVWELL
jgi:hypothetical protein